MSRAPQEVTGYVLHRRPYQEHALLLEVFTLEQGRLGLVARGAARPNARLRPLLEPFRSLTLRCVGRSELRTLTGAEPHAAPLALGGEALLAGFYLNELLLRTLPREDPHEAAFASYAAALDGLAEATGEPGAMARPLRRFEHHLLRELGLAPSFDVDAVSGARLTADAWYRLDLQSGPVAVQGAPDPVHDVPGEFLLALARDDYRRPQVRSFARRLFRRALADHLGGPPLRTPAMLAAWRARRELIDAPQDPT